MAISVYLLAFSLLFSSWVFVGSCQGLGSLQGIVDGVISSGSLNSNNSGQSCFQKILPCQPYLKSPSSDKPEDLCCSPLKKMIQTDQIKCLCEVYKNVVLLNSFDISQQDILKVVKACNEELDISICKKVTPASSPSSESQSQVAKAHSKISSSPDDDPGSTSEEDGSSDSGSGAYGISSHVGASMGFVTAFIVIWF